MICLRDLLPLISKLFIIHRNSSLIIELWSKSKHRKIIKLHNNKWSEFNNNNRLHKPQLPWSPVLTRLTTFKKPWVLLRIIKIWPICRISKVQDEVAIDNNLIYQEECPLYNNSKEAISRTPKTKRTFAHRTPWLNKLHHLRINHRQFKDLPQKVVTNNQFLLKTRVTSNLTCKVQLKQVRAAILSPPLSNNKSLHLKLAVILYTREDSRVL